eukprot:3435441-Prymnesium_polylepis.1
MNHARNCELQVPADLSLPRKRPRPNDLVPWSEANVTLSLVKTLGVPLLHRLENRRAQQAPLENRSSGWEDLIRASQHPTECKRFLLLEDDMLGSGFGFDVRLMAVALLIAVQQQR